MERKKILIVDDEFRMRKIIRDFLEIKKFEVIEAEDGVEALTMFEAEKSLIELIILDVMMPRKDGWEVLKKIRETSNVPIVMLTAKTEENDEVFGFELGADDYIAKPFRPKILIARIEAILARNNNGENILKNYGGIEINESGRTVFVDGENVEFSLREYELLVYLLENEKIALSRDKILNKVWNYDYYGDSRTIDSHIKKIRHKLGGKGEYIQTIRGIGYKFEIK